MCIGGLEDAARTGDPLPTARGKILMAATAPTATKRLLPIFTASLLD
jgi:hypothetical protein